MRGETLIHVSNVVDSSALNAWRIDHGLSKLRNLIKTVSISNTTKIQKMGNGILDTCLESPPGYQTPESQMPPPLFEPLNFTVDIYSLQCMKWQQLMIASISKNGLSIETVMEDDVRSMKSEEYSKYQPLILETSHSLEPRYLCPSTFTVAQSPFNE